MKKEICWAIVWVVAVTLVVTSLVDAHEMSPTYTTDGKTICVADDKPAVLTGWPVGVPAEKPTPTPTIPVDLPEFVDNGDGTITQAGELLWQRGYIVPTDLHRDQRGLNWHSVAQVCDRSKLAGHTTWRVPTIEELKSTEGSSLFDNSPGKFWSSTEKKFGNNVKAYSAYFYDYAQNEYGVTGKQVVGYSGRCVVELQGPTTGYKEVKTGVILDRSTGLKWQKHTPERAYWSDAVSYCDNLNYSGYYDWRLPTYDELATLVDKNYTPTINPIFEGTVSRSYWSISRAGAGARQVNFNGSRSYIYRLGVKLQVRCVR